MGDGLNLIVDVFEKGTNYWLVRTNGGERYDDFIEGDFISVDTSGLTKKELVGLNTKDDIKNLLDKKIAQNISNFDKNYKGKKGSHFKNEVKKMNLSQRSKSHISTRINSFYNEISIGDFIMIPSQSSKSFAIGVIKSEVYESDHDTNASYSLDLELSEENESSNHIVIRDVDWVTFKRRIEVPLELLNSFLTVHHSIISLNENKFYLQGLVNPFFIDEDNRLNMKIEINKEEGLDIKDWQSLYSLLEEIENTSEVKFKEIKSDVQSPGDITPIIETLSNIGTSLAGASPSALTILAIYKFFSKNPEFVSKIAFRMLPENRAKAKVEKTKHEIELSKLQRELDELDNGLQENIKSEVKALIEKDDQPADEDQSDN